MKRKETPFPYSDYYHYEPVRNREGRLVVFLIHKTNGTRTTISNARYIYETGHGIKLRKDQHVDHKDDDKTNDSFDNLQLLNNEDNVDKWIKSSGVTRAMVKLVCPACHTIFIKRRNKTHLCKGGTYTACSRRCSGITSRDMERGIITDLTGNVVEEFSELTPGGNFKPKLG